MSEQAAWIHQYHLQPHPEGGYFAETYRAAGTIDVTALPAAFKGSRSYSTAIVFLLEAGNFSAFHRIASDECWHFYAGDPLHVHVIHPEGKYECILLGKDVVKEERFQAIVPAGCWFASETAAGGNYSFVGCTVAPGFDFADFELAKRAELIALYPQHKALIGRLCRQ